MKLLHTSDWHIGILFNGRSSVEDQRYFAEQLYRIIKEENVDAVLLAGDVFDRSVASAEAIMLYDEIMNTIVGEMGVKVISIAGNHDGAERLSQCHELLERSGLFISGKLSGDFQIVECGNADIYMLPWFTAERAKKEFLEEKENIKSTDDAFRVVCSKIRETFRENRRHILVSHAFIVNAETSQSDRAAEVGLASAVSADVFEGFDYVALGHIHKPQVIRDNIRYCGTPIAYSFGKEEKQQKGVVIIDTDDMSQKFVEIEPLHRRTTIKGTYEEVMDGEFPEDIRKGYVFVEITDEYMTLDTRARLHEKFPNMLDSRGQNLDNEDAGITMTMEEFETVSRNPADLFKAYCREMKQECTDVRMKFFEMAMKESGKEEE